MISLLQGPDRRLAELHFKIGLALQFLQKPEEALQEVDAAISICKQSLDALHSADKVRHPSQINIAKYYLRLFSWNRSDSAVMD